MARQELPKEDLIRDATGMSVRVEAQFESFDDPTVFFLDVFEEDPK